MVVVVFIFCQSFTIVPDLYEVLVCPTNDDGGPSEQCMSSPFIEAIIDLSHLMLAVNSSVNFFIYILHGGQFRQSVVELLNYGKHDDLKIVGVRSLKKCSLWNVRT
jgi:hypothetical protein